MLMWSTHAIVWFRCSDWKLCYKMLHIECMHEKQRQCTAKKGEEVSLTVRHTTELLQEPWTRRCQELCLGSVFKVCKVICVPVVTPDLMVTWRPLLLALTCSVVDVHAAEQIRLFAYPKCERSEDELKIRACNSQEMSDSGRSQQSFWRKLK